MSASWSAVIPPALFADKSDPAAISASTAPTVQLWTAPTSGVVLLSGSFVFTSPLARTSAMTIAEPVAASAPHPSTAWFSVWRPCSFLMFGDIPACRKRSTAATLRSPNRLEERLGLELVSKSAELTFQGRDISARDRRIWLLRVRGCRGGIRVRFESRDAALRNARFDDGVEMPGLAEHLRLELGVHVE